MRVLLGGRCEWWNWHTKPHTHTQPTLSAPPPQSPLPPPRPRLSSFVGFSFAYAKHDTILIKSTLSTTRSFSADAASAVPAVAVAFSAQTPHAGANVLGYIPFYVLYYMLMALHTQFAQSALGIGRRFRRLNNALQLAFPIGNNFRTAHVFRTHFVPRLSCTNYSKHCAVCARKSAEEFVVCGCVVVSIWVAR